LKKNDKKIAAAFLCGILLFAGCGGNEPVEEQINPELDHDHCIHDMTKEELTQMEEELKEVLGVTGVRLIEEKNQDLAVSINLVWGENEFDPGTVTYKIYDLEEGYPDQTTVPMQEIVVEDYSFFDDVPCNVADYNFDGAADFSLWLWGGAQNSQGKFFLWDKEAKLFVENEALGQLTSPMAKEEYKIILEHIHVSGAEFVDVVYRWDNGDLVPVRRIIQEMPVYGTLQGEVCDWYNGNWEKMYERKILLSEGDWMEEDYAKIDDLGRELQVFYDPAYRGF
jgi:hypothetical protein